MSDRTEKLSKLKENQLDELDNWLTFQLKSDCDEESYKELKRDVYLLYAERISELVSKIEVYFHELPMFLYGMITNIVRMHTIVISIEDSHEKYQGYEDILGYERFIVNLLNVVLYEKYKKQIKQYMRGFKRYQYKGVRIKKDVEKDTVRLKGENDEIIDIIDRPLYEVINTQIKRLSADYKVREASFRARYGITRFQVYSFKNSNRKFISNRDIDVKNRNSVIDEDLVRCCSNLEGLVDICEDYYSSVTGSGYKASVWGKIEKVLFWISVILSVYGTIKFFI